MANPQLENGFTRIANELLEALVFLHLPPNEWQILLCIIRKTLGFNSKVSKIANFHIMQDTGLGKTVVSRGINSLLSRNIITKRGKVLGVNQNYDSWKLAELSTKKLAELLTSDDEKLAELSTKVSRIANKKLAGLLTEGSYQRKEKENIKEREDININKEINNKAEDFEKAESVWGDILEGLRPSVSAANFSAYLSETRGISLIGKKLTVGVSRQDQVKSIENMRALIDKVAHQSGYRVMFAVRKNMRDMP